MSTPERTISVNLLESDRTVSVITTTKEKRIKGYLNRNDAIVAIKDNIGARTIEAYTERAMAAVSIIGALGWIIEAFKDNNPLDVTAAFGSLYAAYVFLRHSNDVLGNRDVSKEELKKIENQQH
jgi:hypothetical protein